MLKWIALANAEASTLNAPAILAAKRCDSWVPMLEAICAIALVRPACSWDETAFEISLDTCPSIFSKEPRI